MDGWEGYGPMHNWDGYAFGWFWQILILVLIVLGIAVLVRWFAHPSSQKPKEKTPIEILKERYAKGEINKQEFEEKKRDLLQ
jgi:putative membrane protein